MKGGRGSTEGTRRYPNYLQHYLFPNFYFKYVQFQTLYDQFSGEMSAIGDEIYELGLRELVRKNTHT